MGGSPTSDARQAPPPRPPGPPAAAGSGDSGQRNNALTLIAGVGVLLLAMGVGVLIGRSGVAKQSTVAPEVVTVGSSASGGGASEAPFTSGWPAGSSGYTVQLQTLPESGTSVAAVQAAKSAASAKGAKAVGALKSSEFTSLSPNQYVIYSGDYHKRAQAQKALAALKKSFPGATVVEVSNASSSSASEKAGSSSGGVGTSGKRPAPPSVLKSLKGTKGKSYEEKSLNLPNEVET